MKEAVLLAFFLGSTTIGLLSQQCNSTKLTGPYFGQKPPETITEIFAPGIISKNESDEWGLAVNKEWTEIFFSRSNNDKVSVFHTERHSTVCQNHQLPIFREIIMTLILCCPMSPL